MEEKKAKASGGLNENHKNPFSLFYYLKRSKHDQEGSCQITKQGDVTEDLDPQIGRPVVLVNGNVSVKNFIAL